MEVLVALKTNNADVKTFAASPLAPAATAQQLAAPSGVGRGVGEEGGGRAGAHL